MVMHWIRGARETTWELPLSPLRSELFNADQMEQHGRRLAGRYRTTEGFRGVSLLAQLKENERQLKAVYSVLLDAVAHHHQLTPSGEWLVDNFALVEENIRLAVRHLPRRYQAGLPVLSIGAEAGLPRVYALSLEAISHGDGLVSEPVLRRFIAAFQADGDDLLLGEFWAIPIMLRLGLIENLRRVMSATLLGRLARNTAAQWADRLLDIAEKEPRRLIEAVSEMSRDRIELTPPFVAEFVRRLQGHGAALALPLSWLGQRLAEEGTTIELSIAANIHDQTAAQVSVSNTIGTLRGLDTWDWPDFIESLSAVERTLRLDPSGHYERMDFGSRDQYRHQIEGLARRARLPESRIATAAVEQAKALGDSHVGHLLLGRQRRAFELALGVTRRHDVHWLRNEAPWLIYLGSAAVFAAALFLLALLSGAVPAPTALGVFLALPLAFVFFDAGLVLSHNLLALLLPPRRIARMDYSGSVAGDARTAIVIPTLLQSVSEVHRLLYELEVRFHGNRDAAFSYVLLTDFVDAATEHTGVDALLVKTCGDGIEALNARLGNGEQPFVMLHRPRQFNAQQRTWMGRERKRGKLDDLNRLCLSGDTSAFSALRGGASRLHGARYVITLDADTDLPRGAAREMVGAMDHPLNTPVFDAAGIVEAGYGILQPRVSSGLDGANGSRYAQLMGGNGGVDPYSGLVSSLYQDLFDEASYVGKGIYSVAAFSTAMRERLPDNRILSHDLLESGFVRAGFLSDVELVENYPCTLAEDSARRHRWLRGDWQAAAWMLPISPQASGRWAANPLAGITRWRLADNIRRSFVPASQFLVLVMACLLPHAPLTTLALLLGATLAPAILTTLTNLVRSVHLYRHHLHEFTEAVKRQSFDFAVLPFTLAWQLDAIARTIWRLGTGTMLLEWTASHIKTSAAHRTSFDRWIWAGPLAALVLATVLLLEASAAFWGALPLLVAWLLGPYLARYLAEQDADLQPVYAADERYFRRLASDTWAFFERFTRAEDHFLVPDNVQEHPALVVARRTSPTNVGLSMLTMLAAHDLGLCAPSTALQNVARTLGSVARLERHRGHLYNWYDTATLSPLLPRYVSCVDSGNFLASLWILKTGLEALLEAPVFPRTAIRALKAARRFDLQKPEDVDRRLDALESALARGDLPLAEVLRELRAAAAFVENDPAFLPRLSALLAPLEAICAALGADALRARTRDSLQSLRSRFTGMAGDVQALEQLLNTAKTQIDDLLSADHAFLYDRRRNALAIGYNVEHQRLDGFYYDLMASEARVSVYLAVASGHVPAKAWTALGRQQTPGVRPPSLLSWTGTMFEYLMPMLLMPSFRNSMLEHFNRAAVQQQIDHGRRCDLPWGISESGYNAVDALGNYQYHAFGVPSLALANGQEKDFVIAPYATALAAMVEPQQAAGNLRRLQELGVRGDYGFHEAIDFTKSRCSRDGEPVVVRSFMAHHQAMSLLAINELLNDAPMAKRFIHNPELKASIRLLQERIPTLPAGRTHRRATAQRYVSDRTGPGARVFHTPHTPTPQVQLLSNGSYHVMITNAGGSSSRWKSLYLTRWREDGTRDCWGSFAYVHDVKRNKTWSTSYQPTCAQPERYQARFNDTSAEFFRLDDGIETHTEVFVSPEDDVELRRIRLTNRSADTRVLEVTSYQEMVLTAFANDAAHPAFSNLFVMTEYEPELETLLVTRRPRAASEAHPTVFHMLCVRGDASGDISYETNRARFIGRGRSVANPAALKTEGTLDGSVGCVLDPALSLRQRVTIGPGRTATLDLFLGVADQRAGAVALASKYRDRAMSERIRDLAWTQHQVSLRQLGITEREAQLYQQMASHLLFISDHLRAPPASIAANQRGQSGLWGYSISGDLPLVLIKIARLENIDFVRHLVKAHAYWRSRGLAVDLMIWNEDHAGYRQQLADAISSLIAQPSDRQPDEKSGRMFTRSVEHMPIEDRVLQEAVARIVISDAGGSLEEQVNRRHLDDYDGPLLRPLRRPEASAYRGIDPAFSEPHRLFNGRGGFSVDGREYVIPTDAQQRTPLPWCNVIANHSFGTVISESGSAYTWAENAHEMRLTPWHNDPVTDSGGEALFLRDEETGQYWCPTPLPCDGLMAYRTRHGFGYSVFEHLNRGIRSELWVYVARDASVKFSVLKLHNLSTRPRVLSVTGYVQWVIGNRSEKCGPHVVTQLDADTGALFARNAYTPEFAGKVAFLHLGGERLSVSGDRNEFIGRNGEMRRPAAMRRERLSGRVGAALDPCGAVRCEVSLAAGEVTEVVMLMGLAGDEGHARNMIGRFEGVEAARTALQEVHAQWHELLGGIVVRSSLPSFDALANGWLLYQTISCRLWARSGYYQSGGAFGFRDQLQDTLALVHAAPQLLREQILLCASRQFVEGDVQHWWHPPVGRGVRTRCSDDLLWLPLAVARYSQATGDAGLLDRDIGFLEGKALAEHQESDYDLPRASASSASLYEHCCRALRRVELGAHGIPLIGAGDWNDGMNLVGIEGRGESTWLGFFYAKVLDDFAAVSALRGDTDMVAWMADRAATVRAAIETSGWDGEWYRRAYFDDGTPLGTATAAECQIDSIAQSWSVLSSTEVGSDRQQRALQSLERRLVDEKFELIKLLDPPFDKSDPDPGYIRGYPPGVRENGGQYTHAAIWAAMAFARIGDGPTAWRLAEMINPARRSRDQETSGIYRGEPYVMSADIYAVPPHCGRSGWSWYTGSAGWMYRLLVESLLGLQREGNQLRIEPCWKDREDRAEIVYTHASGRVSITVHWLPDAATNQIMMNGKILPSRVVPLNAGESQVVVTVARRTP